MRVVIFITCLFISSNLLAQINVDGDKILDAIISPKDTVYSAHHNNKNTHYINLSMGFFNPVDFAFNLANINSVSGSPSPALNLDYNYAINGNLSIGTFANYYRVNAQYKPKLSELETIVDESLDCINEIGGIDDILEGINCISNQVNEEITIEERLNVFTLGGKASLHKRLLPKFDTYVATYLGFSFNNRKNIVETALDEYAADLLNRSSVDVPQFAYFINAGIRYYLTPNIGIYGEFGYGNVHLAKLGLTFRL